MKKDNLADNKRDKKYIFWLQHGLQFPKQFTNLKCQWSLPMQNQLPQ